MSFLLFFFFLRIAVDTHRHLGSREYVTRRRGNHSTASRLPGLWGASGILEGTPSVIKIHPDKTYQMWVNQGSESCLLELNRRGSIEV